LITPLPDGPVAHHDTGPVDPVTALTPATLGRAIDELSTRDAGLAGIVARYGPPPMWARDPGFPTLVHLVLEQQVSLASARAPFDRLRVAADPLTPAALLALDDAALLAIGFSRQKRRYARALATAILDGSLDLAGLPLLTDEEVDGPWPRRPASG